jgi:hypothetical protein
MLDPYTRERIENWAGDFCASDALREFPAGMSEFAADLVTRFLVAACEARNVDPAEIEERDLKPALMTLARLEIPASIRGHVPALCGDSLAFLESEGRLSDGRVLGAYVRALRSAFDEAASGKSKPIVNPGSKLGRNDPCPCGSGKKYKKCCMRE